MRRREPLPQQQQQSPCGSSLIASSLCLDFQLGRRGPVLFTTAAAQAPFSGRKQAAPSEALSCHSTRGLVDRSRLEEKRCSAWRQVSPEHCCSSFVQWHTHLLQWVALHRRHGCQLHSSHLLQLLEVLYVIVGLLSLERIASRGLDTSVLPVVFYGIGLI